MTALATSQRDLVLMALNQEKNPEWHIWFAWYPVKCDLDKKLQFWCYVGRRWNNDSDDPVEWDWEYKILHRKS